MSTGTVCVYFEGEAYDVPLSYAAEHPGGGELITDNADTDITELFENEDHSSYARSLLEQWRRTEGSAGAAKQDSHYDARVYSPTSGNNNTSSLLSRPPLEKGSSEGDPMAPRRAWAAGEPRDWVRITAAAALAVASVVIVAAVAQRVLHRK